MNIQWYPGHMTKTRRMMEENLTLVDIVIELVDARIPYSSKNPDIDNLAKHKHRIIVMNKADLADPKASDLWAKYFTEKGFHVVLTNSISGKGMKEIIEISKVLMQEKVERLRARGRISVPTRAMIVGIPNVGKSTLINKYSGKASAKVGDRPGVTRGKQWVKINKEFELLDTPGILWPKFEDKVVGLKLAATGAINDDVLVKTELAQKLIEMLLEIDPDCLKSRYKIEFDENDKSYEVLAKIATARGFIQKGAELDLERAAIILLDEFRGLKLGKITLELPEK